MAFACCGMQRHQEAPCIFHHAAGNCLLSCIPCILAQCEQTAVALCCPQERFRGYGVVKAEATWQDAFLLTKLAPQLVLARQASHMM